MSGGDRLGALQDDLVQHVLSFLPSRDAVKSAALSRRWRHLWRSTPAVCVKGAGSDRFRLFVTSLLLYRDASSPLRSFEIDADCLTIGDNEEYYEFGLRQVDHHVDVWIRHAVTVCGARSLTARFEEEDDPMWSPRHRRPFASPHLTTIRLHHVKLAGGLLDFSCCPALLHLTLSDCSLQGDDFVSPSLESLSIMDCSSIDDLNSDWHSRMRISTPSLRYLHLSDTRPLSLESMPWLTSASILLTGSIHGDDDDGSAGGSLLLHGLSEATNLELIAPPSHISLLRELKWCPTFSKLRTLILNEWCVYADVTALGCLLRHTPRLESLILQLPLKNRPTLEEKTEGSHCTSEQSFLALEHLKKVEIKNCLRPCFFQRLVYPSKKVVDILKLFSELGIPSSKIIINYKKPEGKRKIIKC